MTQRDINYHLTQFFTSVQQFLIRLFAIIQRQAKQVQPAMLAIALFLGVAFTFAVKGDLLGQTAQTAMLPELVVTADRADTLSSAETASLEAASNYVVGQQLEKMEPLPPQEIDTETLWLARVMYSETKKPQEQELVGWVVRNRMETEYRGRDSYQEVALDPYQFSAFNPGTRTRRHYSSLTTGSREPGWQNALSIAKQVKEAPDSLRPFSGTTRHFFSEQSMSGGRHPNWARGEAPVAPERPMKLDAKRFRFYEDIG